MFFIERFTPVIIFNPRAGKRRNKSLLMYLLSANKKLFIFAVIWGTADQSSTFPFVSFAFIKFSWSSVIMCNLKPKNRLFVAFHLSASSLRLYFVNSLRMTYVFKDVESMYAISLLFFKVQQNKRVKKYNIRGISATNLS